MRKKMSLIDDKIKVIAYPRRSHLKIESSEKKDNDVTDKKPGGIIISELSPWLQTFFTPRKNFRRENSEKSKKYKDLVFESIIEKYEKITSKEAKKAIDMRFEILTKLQKDNKSGILNE
jgi:hypothetical protein